MKEMTISTDEILMIDRKPFFLIAGEIHPARIPPELWEDRIAKMKASGLNAVNIYLFWNWLERNGKLDFGEIREFIRLVEKYGLKMILRPGAYTCAEWLGGGYPERLLDENISLRTLDPEYLKLEREYHAAVVGALKDMFYPNGPIILYQIENEFFWGLSPYLISLYKIALELGVNVPIIVNENATVAKKTPIINGADFYPVPPDLTPEIMTIARVLLWNRYRNKKKPNIAVEMEGGWFLQYGSKFRTTTYGEIPSWWTDIVMKTAVGFGLDGWSMYMFVGGTNWPWWAGGGASRIATTYDYTAPIGEMGQINPRYHVVRLFSLFLRDMGRYILGTRPTGSPFLKFISFALRAGKPRFIKFERKASKTRVFKCGIKWNPRMRFTFAINVTTQQHMLKVKSLAGEVYITVAPHSAKVIPINVELAPGLLLAHITSQLIECRLYEGIWWISCYDYVDNGEIAFIKDGKVYRTSFKHDSVAQWLDVGGVKIVIFPIPADDAKWYWSFKGIPAVIRNARVILDEDIEAVGDLEFTLADTISFKLNDTKFAPEEKSNLRYGVEISAPNFNIEPIGYAPLTFGEWSKWTWRNQKPGYLLYKLPAGKLLVGFKDVMRVLDEKGKDIVISSLKTPPSTQQGWFNFLHSLEGAVVELDNANEKKLLVENTGSRNLIPLAKGGLLFAIRPRSRITVKKWKFKWGWLPLPVRMSLIATASSFILPIKKITWWTEFNAPEDGWLIFHGITEDAKIKINDNIYRATNARSPFIIPIQKGKNKISVHTANIHGQGTLGKVEFVSGELVEAEFAEIKKPHDSEFTSKKPKSRVFWKRYSLNVSWKPKVVSPPQLVIKPKNGNKLTRIVIYLNGRPVGRYEGIGPQDDFYLPEPWVTENSVIDLLVDGADDVDVDLRFPYLATKVKYV